MTMSNLEQAIAKYLTWSPLSLVIRETCRIHAFRKVIDEENLGTDLKILDVGCGDGRWWNYLSVSKNYQVFGVDINEREIEKAIETIKARVLDITDLQAVGTLPQDFDLVVGNCSLEHIPRINEALKNINSVLKPGGTFILFVPTPTWALKGKSLEFLSKISPRLSMAFSGLLNGFFQHWHLYHYEIWNHLLSSNGFQTKKVLGLGTKRLEFLFRLFLPMSFVSFLVKSLTGKYLSFFSSFVVPKTYYESLAQELSPLISESVVSAEDENAFEYIILARKA
jgi:SAM-dependent methyltransferase